VHVTPRRAHPAPSITTGSPPAPPPPPAAPPAVPTDSLTISDEARSLAVTRQAVESAPDVRAERVAALKQALANGTYDVPAESLARAILRSEP
jgi:negative regulator of flagellin synthesis FlgM